MYYFDHLSFPIYVLHIFSSQTHSGFSHTEFDVVQQLPNRGREGDTYLHQIIDNYNTLANHILFSQAGVEGMTSTGLSDWKNNSIHQLDIWH